MAISWVLIYHASIFKLVSPDYWIVSFGWMGVDLFFVLSGFLIGGQLLRPRARGEVPCYRRFFWRRALRTLPAYLAILSLYVLIPTIRERPELQPSWQFLTFTENFDVTYHLPKAFSQAWSLCVEEQFYVFLPLVAALLAIRPSTEKIVGAMLAVLLAGMVFRGYLWLHAVGDDPFDFKPKLSGFWYMTLIYYPTWSRLDGLLVGVAAAAMQTFRPAWWRRLTATPDALLAVGISGVGIAIVFFHRMFAPFLPAVFGFPLVACSMGLIVIAGSDNRSIIGRHRIPGSEALAAAAYSLYLCNKLVFNAVETIVEQHIKIEIVALPIGLFAASVAGVALYWVVERPFLKLRDRLPR